MSQPTPEHAPFSTLPFYIPRADRPIVKDLRVYRPVLDAEGESGGLRTFYDHVVSVLGDAGLGENDATLLAPDQFEVSIASRGTINTAAKADLLRDMEPSSIGSELLRIIRPAHDVDVPIEGTIGLIALAKRYNPNEDRAGRPLHIAAFLDLTKGMGRIGVERFQAYEALGVWSNNPAVKNKLQLNKDPMFRFVALHGITTATDPRIMRKLLPKQPVSVVLGAPKAAPFGNR